MPQLYMMDKIQGNGFIERLKATRVKWLDAPLS